MFCYTNKWGFFIPLRFLLDFLLLEYIIGPRQDSDCRKLKSLSLWKTEQKGGKMKSTLGEGWQDQRRRNFIRFFVANVLKIVIVGMQRDHKLCLAE